MKSNFKIKINNTQFNGTVTKTKIIRMKKTAVMSEIFDDFFGYNRLACGNNKLTFFKILFEYLIGAYNIKMLFDVVNPLF